MSVWKDFVFLGGEGGNLRIWNLISSEEVCKLQKPEKIGISSITISEDGQSVVSGDDNGGVSWWTI